MHPKFQKISKRWGDSKSKLLPSASVNRRHALGFNLDRLTTKLRLILLVTKNMVLISLNFFCSIFYFTSWYSKNVHVGGSESLNYLIRHENCLHRYNYHNYLMEWRGEVRGLKVSAFYRVRTKNCLILNSVIPAHSVMRHHSFHVRSGTNKLWHYFGPEPSLWIFAKS